MENRNHTRPLSLSGVEIEGESLVRYIYADESGVSASESILVVAGVIIHADSQWEEVETHIRQLIHKYVAEEDRSSFVFHANELFHGSGRVFGNREKYLLQRSREALKEVLSIPSKFKLPLIFGFVRKEQNPPEQTKKARLEALALDHALAFSYCAIGAERFMRNFAPTEVATIIAEDNTQTKKTVRLMHDVLRGIHPDYTHWVETRASEMNLGHDFFPLRKLVDTVHFVEKSGGFLVQIADACAFLFRCCLEDKPNIEEFVSAFVPTEPPDIIAKSIRMQPGYAGGLKEIKSWV